MVVLITGKGGQLASCLQDTAPSSGLKCAAVDRSTLDLTKIDTIESTVKSIQPELVINAAGYTDVETAESRDAAELAGNSTGLGNLAQICAKSDIPIIHLSTDYVFDGNKRTPYTEGDENNPINNYGKSKLAGERLLISNHPQHIILRTAWIHSPYGKNFVKTMLQRAQTINEIAVVNDQVGSPTYGIDLSKTIWMIANNVVQKTITPKDWGVFNVANAGRATWFDLAQEVFKQSKNLGGPIASVNPVSSQQFSSKTKRPQNSSLDCSKLKDTFNISLPSWQKGVSLCVSKILNSIENS